MQAKRAQSLFPVRVAQWIEQKFPKLLVGGSIPLPDTSFQPRVPAHGSAGLFSVRGMHNNSVVKVHYRLGSS